MSTMVFGAGGMIGREVSCQLSAAGVRDYVTVGRGEELSYIVDLNNREAVGDVLERVRPDIVINCAGAPTGIPDKPYESFGATILEQISIKNLAPLRIVLMGTLAVYGAVPHDCLPVCEDDPVYGELTAYGRCKLEERRIARSYRDAGYPVTIAQVGNVVGPSMSPTQLLPRLLACAALARAGRSFVPVYGPLRSCRSYIHVEDAARALILVAMEKPNNIEGRPSFLYEIGASEALSNYEVAEMVAVAHDLDATTQLMVGRGKADLYASKASTALIRHDFGWSPRYSCREAIARAIEQNS